MNGRNLPPLPPGFEFEAAGAPQGANGGLPPLPPGFMLEPPQQAPGAMQRLSQPEEGRGFFHSIDAAVRGVADAATFGFADEISAGLGAATGIGGTFGDYYGNLERQRARDEGDEKTNGTARLAGQVAGSVGVPVGMARNGLTLVKEGGSILQKGLRYAGEGAAYGGAYGLGSATEDGRVAGAFDGAWKGAAGGVAAPAALAGVSRAAQPVVNAVRGSFGPAPTQATNRIMAQMQAAGLTPAQAEARLRELGPDAILADVMGARGQDLARSAANVSPEARQTLEGVTGPRNATRNERVVGAIEDAAGLPAGSRQSVDDLKAAAYAQQEPAINAAYQEARALGYDLPLEDFQEIIGSPLGARAFREASRAVQNRMAAGDQGAASNLGLLDAMKRRLDASGQVAGRAGDNDAASQASQLSAALRRQMDGLLEGPEYANARAMREAAYRTDDAFDQGADLAARRVPFGAAEAARGGGTGPVRPEVAQGYAATIAQDLLNQPGGLDRLSSPLQREAMDTALQGGAQRVRDQLGREQVFQGTHRAVVGNSTTARQLMSMGIFGGAGAGLGYANGMDPTQMGMTAIAAALARRGAGAAVTRLRAGNEEQVANALARALASGRIPASPEEVARIAGNSKRAVALYQALAAGSGQQAAIQGQ